MNNVDIDTLVRELVELPRAERVGRLDALDLEASVRTTIERLLAHFDTLLETENVLPGAVEMDRVARLVLGSESGQRNTGFEGALLEASDGPLPERIGPYRVLAVIGRGGMGVVYLAEQDEPRRQVAIKVLHPGDSRAEVLRRFEQEAGLLARLQHPGIAHVHDLGRTDDGAIYFVMEYVEGLSLDRFVESRKLGITDRVGLLIQLADAVHHAHLRGVVHRDLKPANVLVTQEGCVKVIDFGVARNLDPDPATDMQTMPGQIVGTLAYMSPEQIRGDLGSMDARTDVYALGVIAYELLGGRLPHDLSSTTITEAARVVNDVTPERLGRVDPRCRGDLERVVAQALAKDPERRYDSAAALSADLTRVVNHQAISARPPNALYLLGRMGRRHRLASAALAVALVSVVGGGGFAWFEAERNHDLAVMEAAARKLATTRAGEAADARAEAERRADDLQQVANFQAQQLSDVDVELMGIRLRRDILDAVPSDRRASLTHALSDQNFTDLALGSLRQNIFDRTARAIDEEFSDQPLVEAQLLDSMAAALTKLGLFEDALAPVDRMWALRREQLGEDHVATLDALRQRGEQLLLIERYEDAAAVLEEALEAARRVLGNDDPVTVGTLLALGSARFQQGQRDEAERWLREALDTSRRTLGDNDPRTLLATDKLASLLVSRGEVEAGSTLYEHLYETTRQLYGDDHRLTLERLVTLGTLYEVSGRFADGEELLRGGLTSIRASLGDQHPQTLAVMIALADALERQARLSEAEPLAREAYDTSRLIFGAGQPRTLAAGHTLGEILQKIGRLPEAEPLLRAHLDSKQSRWGDEHPETIDAKGSYGMLLWQIGRLDEAIELAREVLASSRRVLGADHPNTFTSAMNLAVLLRDAGESTRAVALFREAYEGNRRVIGRDTLSTMIAVSQLIVTLERRGETTGLIELRTDYAEGAAAVFGEDHVVARDARAALERARQTDG